MFQGIHVNVDATLVGFLVIEKGEPKTGPALAPLSPSEGLVEDTRRCLVSD
jgi:hypothetical protein